MLDIDGFFKKHGSTVLRFEIRVAGAVERVDFTKDFLLGANRTNPFAIQERLDESSSKVAFYGTLYVAALDKLKARKREYQTWYAKQAKAARSVLIKTTNESSMAYGMKRAPSNEEVEHEVSNGEQGDAYRKWQEELAVFERDSENMKILFEASRLDAEAVRSMSSIEKTLIDKGLIEPGGFPARRQEAPAGPSATDSPKKIKHDPDAEF